MSAFDPKRTLATPFSSPYLSRYDALDVSGHAMRQRDEAAKKRRRKPSPPRRRSVSKAPHRNNSSPTSEENNVARLSRELNEAFEQQAATADILNIISSSPSDTQPVFKPILHTVLKLFPAALTTL